MSHKVLISSLVVAALATTARVAHANEDISKSDLIVVQPDAGRPRVGVMKPGWCDLTSKYKGKTRMSGVVHRALWSAQRYFNGKSASHIAELLCVHPDNPSWQKQTGYFMQMYVNMTGLSPKKAVASIRARLHRAKWKHDKKAFCDKMYISDEASPAQKRAYEAKVKFYGCGRSGPAWYGPLDTLHTKLEWDLDRHADMPSETTRIDYVMGCLKGSRSASIKNKRSLLPYSLCGVDARALSWPRLEKQLASGDHNSYSRTIARENMAFALAQAKRYLVQVDKLAKHDPTYKRIFYTVPEAAWKSWEQIYAKYKPMIEAAYAFENKLYGPSKSALNGCLKPLRRQLGDYIRARKPRSQKALEAVLFDDVGSRLLGALMPCAQYESNPWEAGTYMRLHKKAREVRGPRYAMYYAVINEIQKVKKDRTRFPLDVGMFGYKHHDRAYAKYLSMTKNGTISQMGMGVVRRMRRVRGGIKLYFRTVRWKETVWECHDTNKIWRIDNGTVKYHQSCIARGKKWRKRTEKPIVIPRYSAAGIRRGRFVELRADYPFPSKKHVRHGFPNRVYRSKRKRKLLAGYGFKL